MISAFQCDFSLARDGYLKLAKFDYILDKTEGKELVNDIDGKHFKKMNYLKKKY